MQVRQVGLLYGCETWPVIVADERMLAPYENDSSHRVLHAKHIVYAEVYLHSMYKDGFGGSFTLQDTPMVS